MKRLAVIMFIFGICLVGRAHGSQIIIAARVDQPPAIDGDSTEAAWARARSITLQDKVTKIGITLKAIHTQKAIFFLVRYADATEEREHKTLIWDEELEFYKTGPTREDSFVFKWNMEPDPVDLTLSANRPYQADIWYWKAARTDHAGYADDKMQLYTAHNQKKSKKMLSKDGRLFYLRRSGDNGNAAYKAKAQQGFTRKTQPQFEFVKPTGSRADVHAKGIWKNGAWTIEFARQLQTGHADDIAFDLKGRYQFGISVYEIAGRRQNRKIDKPLFGSGEIGETVTLVFE